MRPTTWSLLLFAGVLAACDVVGDSNAPSNTMPSRTEHGSRYFPIAAPGAHDQQSCDDCHGGFDTFRKFDCVTCHAGTAPEAAALTATHANEADFPDLSDPDKATTSGLCLLCHADGTAIGVNHAAKFPIDAASAHAGASCSECHVDPANRKTLGCAGCHPHESATVATQHTGVAGYQFTASLCVRCHADSQVDTRAAHLPFRITTGDHSGSDGGRCLVCHPAMRADKPFGTDFTVVSCLDCHSKSSTDAEHRGESGYAYTTAKCLECHPDGSS